jgi:streptogrisin C
VFEILAVCRMTWRRLALVAIAAIAAGCSVALLAPIAVAAEAPAVAASLAQQEHVSLEKAELDLRLQRQAGNIAEELKDKLGTGYAGLWFDLKGGRFHIDVTSQAKQTIAEEVTNKDGITTDTDFDPVTHTWSELQATEATLNSQLAPLKLKQQAFVGADAQTNSVNVSIASNAAPTAVTQADTDAAAMSVRTTVAPVVPQTLDQVASSCSFPYCSNPQRGGVRINSESDSNGEYHFCTAGFVVNIPTIKYRGILTAGHCMEPEGHAWSKGIWSTSECPFGDAIKHVLSETQYGGADAGLIVNKHNCELEPYISAWGKNENLPIYGEKEAYQGRYLCHEGATSGSQCGNVTYINVTTAINYSAEGRGILNIGHTDQMCAHGERGDSGGPWANWNTEPPTEAWGSDIDLAANEKTCPEGGTSTGFELPVALSIMSATLEKF